MRMYAYIAHTQQTRGEWTGGVRSLPSLLA